MKTNFTFGKIFFGIVILLFGGFLWATLKPSPDTGTPVDRISESAKGTVGKIGDSAAGFKEKTAAMVDNAAKTAGGMAEKVADKTGDMMGQAADKAGDAYQAAGDMTEKVMDKAGDMAGQAADKAEGAYQAAGDMAEKAVDKVEGMGGKAGDRALDAYRAKEGAGETSQATVDSGDSVDKAKDAFRSAAETSTSEQSDQMKTTMASAGKAMGKDDASMAVEQTGDRIVEVPAKYQMKGSEDATRPALTEAGTWRYDDVRFDHNQWELKDSSLLSLQKLAALMNAQPDLNIEIHGHTDSSGSSAYNMDLSYKRAASVRAYLESQGIASARMVVKGYGSDHPLSSRASEDNFSENRRVEIKPLN